MDNPSDQSLRMLPLALVLIVGLTAGSGLWRTPQPRPFDERTAAAVQRSQTPSGRTSDSKEPSSDVRRYLPAGYVPALWPLANLLGSHAFLEIDSDNDLVIADAYFERVLCWLGEQELRAGSPNRPCTDDVRERGLDRLSRDKDDFRPKLARATVATMRQLAESRNLSVEFVVATLPDYVDSNGAWFFDTLLDPIKRAAADAGYNYHSHYLPESLPVRSDARVVRDHLDRLSHEDVPGAVVFRSVEDCPAPCADPPAARGAGDRLPAKVLVVLVVVETATAGIHHAAFRAALDLVTTWHPSSLRPVRILGPTFTGSVYSLHTALQDYLAAYPETDSERTSRQAAGRERVRIVSGSATGGSNARRLTMLEAGGHSVVTYSATTRSDPEMIAAILRKLLELNPGWEHGNGVALLHEVTAWGSGFAEPEVRDLMPRATFISFPMHISRLRATKAEPPSTPADPPRARLRLRDEREARDRVPSMTPEITAGLVDSVLEQIFTTLRRENVTAVGVLATDKRDHLFLAQEMARRAPDVFVFALEGNLLYLHPEAAAFLRGTLVASSYPLFGRTQRGRERLRLFPAVGAQGVYNATMLLLDQRELIDYRPRTDAARTDASTGRNVARVALSSPSVDRPSASDGAHVWLSVVGRRTFWPLSSTPSEGIATAEDYLSRWQARSGAFGLATLATWLLLLSLACVTLAPTRFADGGGVRREGDRFRWLRSLRWLRRFRRPVCRQSDAPNISSAHAHERCVQLDYEHRVTLFAAVTAIGLVAVWLSQVILVLAADGRASDLLRAWSIVREGIFVALVPFAAWAFVPGVKRLTSLWLQSSPGTAGTSVAWLRLVPLSFAAIAIWHFRTYLAADHWTGHNGLYHVERTMALESLISPALPIVLLCAAVFWWSAWNLRRVYLASTPYDGESGVMVLLQRRAAPHGWNFRDVLNNPVLRVGTEAWIWLLLLAALAVPFVLAWNTGVTVDGEAFGRVLWWGTACLLLILAHTLANALYMGRALLHLLHSLGRHGLADAFSDLHGEPLNWRLSFRSLKAGDTEPLYRRLEAVSREVDAVIVRRHLRASNGARSSGIERYLRKNRRLLPAPAPLVQERDEAAARSLGVRVEDGASIGAALLEHDGIAETAVKSGACAQGAIGKWHFTERRQLLNRTAAWGVSGKVSAWMIAWLERSYWSWPERLRAASDLAPVCREAQRLIAMQVAMIIRDLLTRLVSGFSVVLGGLLLVTSAHLLYSFQGRRTWLILDWVYLGVAAAIIMALLISLEKTAVLRKLWGAQPGRINWSSGFGYRILAYGAVPLVTLFATVFPEVGGSLLSWLEPVRKVLP